jgi:uncharacterized protein (DUF2147 family)
MEQLFNRMSGSRIVKMTFSSVTGGKSSTVVCFEAELKIGVAVVAGKITKSLAASHQRNQIVGYRS